MNTKAKNYARRAIESTIRNNELIIDGEQAVVFRLDFDKECFIRYMLLVCDTLYTIGIKHERKRRSSSIQRRYTKRLEYLNFKAKGIEPLNINYCMFSDFIKHLTLEKDSCCMKNGKQDASTNK